MVKEKTQFTALKNLGVNKMGRNIPSLFFKMNFVVDSREKRSYEMYFSKLNYPYTVKKLEIGDYSILGYEDRFSVERKSLADFINCITQDRDRFKKELQRASSLDYFAVLVECSFFDIQNRNYKSKIHPSSILGTIFKWSVKYSIPFFFVETHTGGAVAFIKLSEAYLKYKVYKHE